MENENKRAIVGSSRRGYPLLSLDPNGSVLRLVKAISKIGAPADRKRILSEANIKSIGLVLSSARRYGLIEKNGVKSGLSPLGEKYSSTSDMIEKKDIIMQLLASVPIFREITEHNKSYIPIPTSETIRAWVSETHKVQKKDVMNVASAFRSTLKAWNITFSTFKAYIEKGALTYNTGQETVQQKVVSTDKYADISKIGYLIAIADAAKVEATRVKRFIADINLPDSFTELSSALIGLKATIDYLDDSNLKKYIQDKLKPALIKDTSVKLENLLPETKTTDKKIEEVDDKKS